MKEPSGLMNSEFEAIVTELVGEGARVAVSRNEPDESAQIEHELTSQGFETISAACEVAVDADIESLSHARSMGSTSWCAMPKLHAIAGRDAHQRAQSFQAAIWGNFIYR